MQWAMILTAVLTCHTHTTDTLWVGPTLLAASSLKSGSIELDGHEGEIESDDHLTITHLSHLGGLSLDMVLLFFYYYLFFSPNLQHKLTIGWYMMLVQKGCALNTIGEMLKGLHSNK